MMTLQRRVFLWALVLMSSAALAPRKAPLVKVGRRAMGSAAAALAFFNMVPVAQGS